MSAASLFYLALALGACGVGAWFHGQGQAVRLRLAAERRAHSRAPYHGALCAAAALMAGGAGWLAAAAAGAEAGVQLLALCASALAAAGVAGRLTGPERQARLLSERLARGLMLGAASLALVVSVGIVLTLLLEALLFFGDVSVVEFLFGTQWSPRSALEGGAEMGGLYGSVPVFAGTLLVALIAIGVAGPIGLMIAVFLSEYASAPTRAVLKPTTEVLAGIPPVVYGLFAVLAVGPGLRDLGAALGLAVPVQSALAAGLVMALMILPLVSSLCDDAMSAVPQSLRDGSSALGATPSETVLGVVIPGALPGIAAAVLLALSRAVGETMIVLLAAGRGAQLSLDPLDTVTTVTVQIVALLTGEPIFDSTKTRAAFALGLVLFVLTLLLNALAAWGVGRFRRRVSGAAA